MDFTGFMAAFALAAFWLNTVLIAAAGWSECVALRRRYAFLSSGTARGEVVAGAGPDGAIAAWRVVQVGRSNGRGPILFHDRGRASPVFGGVVQVAGQELGVPAGATAEVWLGPRARARAVACPDAQSFAAAMPAASRAAGWERTVEVPLRAGDAIWFTGQAPENQGNSRYILADFDPRRWRARITAMTAGLVVGLLVVAGACTAACLWPPAFGMVSKLGAFAALVAFNLFQLFGKLHHDAIQPPAAAILGGSWRRPR
ncbi:MAG TPA: hypothetical protein VGB85_03860 [Nannocystis sp.]